MMNMNSSTTPVFAKTIVLGNSKSGRSSLIQNLEDCGPVRGNDYEAPKQYSVNHDHNFFSAIELIPQELENSNQSAVLKIWEYSEHLSKKDETMVFRGALFCIIVFNILDLDSYQAVFDKWIPLKEKMSPDSFLYIVGTHLDQAHYRRIQLHDICKACAKKDAAYVELSNVDGYNFPLLRKLLCKRVQFMIAKREALASRNLGTSYSSNSNGQMNDDQSEDNNNNNNNNNMNNNMNNQGNSNQSSNSSMNKNHKNASNSSSNPKANNTNNKSEISISYLEPNIMTNSVGAILSSYFGLESWEGWEAHEHEITKIVDRIDTFIEKLSSSAENNAFLDLNNMIVGEDVFRRESQDLPLKSIELEEFDPTFQKNQNIQDSLQELNETLKVLGLSLPNHLMPSDPSPPPPPTNEKGQSNLKSSNPSGNNSSGVQFPNRTHLRRMVIKLPQGQTGELMIDLESNVESQVDLFLETHGMDDDLEARRKLLQSVLKMQREYLEANNSSARVNNFYNNNNNNNNSNNNGRASLQQGTPPQRTSSMNYGKRE